MRLTREQRSAIFVGEHPTITVPYNQEHPELGYAFKLSSKVSLEVTGRRRRKDGRDVVEYRIQDDRPRLLRAAPPAHDFEKDREGAPSKDIIERAAQESAYTSSEQAAISGEPEAVPRDYQEKLSAESRQRDAAIREKQRREVAIEERLRRSRQKAIDAGEDVSRIDRSVEQRIKAYERKAA